MIFSIFSEIKECTSLYGKKNKTDCFCTKNFFIEFPDFK